MTFEDRLNKARTGKGILFCGAGFTADCLNFNDLNEIGVGAHLLQILNSELKKRGHLNGFKDVKNASDSYMAAEGEHGLLELLVDRFKIQNISADMVDIVNFPWERIYTTNYDNGLELALQRAGREPKSLNNTDKSANVAGSGIEVVHLHGFIEKWGISNFRQSCILGAESYHRLDVLKEWLELFRNDVDRAEVVTFVGTNSPDFHLNDVLFNISALRDKIFFVNRPTASPDPDTDMTQRRFGLPLYIGRKGLAEEVVKARSGDLPEEPALSSFVRYVPPVPSTEVPSVKDIEDLLIFGRIVPEHLARDISRNVSDYHVLRALTVAVQDALDSDTCIALVVGEICDGKTLIIEELCNRMAVGRPVFRLRHHYDDLLDEVVRILNVYPGAALVIENCFDLNQERLKGLARLFDKSPSVLVLTSRNIAAEAEIAEIRLLNEFETFKAFYVPRLNDAETNAISALTDQIAGWIEFSSRGPSDRIKFIQDTCSGSLPSLLLRLLHSEYVRGRYKEEYNKTNAFNPTEMRAIITTLHIAHIGHQTPLSFLSDIFSFDVGSFLDRLDGQNNAFKLLRVRGQYVETVPAIGATNILKEIIPPEEIVAAIVHALDHISQSSTRDDFKRHIFSQMMRYSILRAVVNDVDLINRFFDQVSKIEYCRSRILFWLQWHMAKSDQSAFLDAEKYLARGYTEAENYEKRSGKKYDRKQLDDRRAKFLMKRSMTASRDSTALNNDLREACQIVTRLLNREDITHHPYETLEFISEFIVARNHDFNDALRPIAHQTIAKLIRRAKERIGMVAEGYQRSMAERAIKNTESTISQF